MEERRVIRGKKVVEWEGTIQGGLGGAGPESWGKQGHDRGRVRSCSPGSWHRGVDTPRMRVGVCVEETVIYGRRQIRRFRGKKKRESKKIRKQGAGKVEGGKGREGKSS